MNTFVSFAVVLFASVAAVQCSSYGALPPPPPPPSYGGGAPSYGGPAIQQVNLASLGNLAGLASSYLNGGGGSSYGSGSSSGSTSYAPAKYVVAPSAPIAGHVSSHSHSSAPSGGYGHHHHHHHAPSGGYGAPAPAPAPAPPSIGYGAAPSIPSYGAAPSAPSYGGGSQGGYGGGSAGGYGGAAPKFSVLPAWVSQINAGKHSYKTYQTPIHYSTVALPIVPGGPVAKLFVPEHSGYGGGSSYGSSGSSYGGSGY